MTIEHSADIPATPEAVFQLTIDIERWPAMMSTVTAVTRLDEGPLRVGSAARVKQPLQRAKVWTVTVLNPSQEFTWEAKVWGVRTVAQHLVSALPHGCRNRLSITFSGRRGAFIERMLHRRLSAVLAIENEAFRSAATSASVA
jgi:uncharacterized membrane protein